MFRLSIVAAVLLVSAGLAHAGSLPAALEAAIDNAEARKTAAADLQFAFSVHTVTSEKEFRLRYDPARPEVWTLESPETEETAKLRERMVKRAEEQDEGSDRQLMIGDLRKLFGDRIELTEDSTDRRVYRFSLSPEAEIGDGGRSFDASAHLTGELAIGADDRLLWLRFFAEEAFKPVFVARIDTFDLKLFVDTIWPDGPYVVVRQVMNLNGSAFFKSFSEDVRTVYSEFERR